MICRADADETATRQLGESPLYVGAWDRTDGWHQLRHDFPPVGDLDRMPGPGSAHVMAETILQLAKPNPIHMTNVAS